MWKHHQQRCSSDCCQKVADDGDRRLAKTRFLLVVAHTSQEGPICVWTVLISVRKPFGEKAQCIFDLHITTNGAMRCAPSCFLRTLPEIQQAIDKVVRILI